MRRKKEKREGAKMGGDQGEVGRGRKWGQWGNWKTGSIWMKIIPASKNQRSINKFHYIICHD